MQNPSKILKYYAQPTDVVQGQIYRMPIYRFAFGEYRAQRPIKGRFSPT
jgi:hypothetical protein